MENRKNLLAVVMCGGESRRMGTDKGLMKTGDETWVEHVAKTAKSLQLPVVISINEKQKEAYGKLFFEEELVVDKVEVPGAIKGLFSVHQSFPNKDLLLLACDMVEMNSSTILHLIEAYENEEGADYIAYQQHDIIEPFCTIYTAKALQKVYAEIEQHQLKKFSFQHILENKNTILLQKPQQHPFNNYNSKEDLNRPEEYKA